MKNRSQILAALALLGLILSLSACDSADNPVAPTSSVLTLTANPNKIGLGGDQSVITVTGFKPDGNPLNPGTQVRLTTDQGTLRSVAGGCSSSQLLTIVEIVSGGRAEALLCSDGRAGDATVTASLTTVSGGGGGGGDGGGDDGGGTTGGGSGTTTATVTVQIGEDETDRPTLVMTANPSTIPTGSRSDIQILARSSDNTPLGNSRIRLTSDLGKVVEAGGNAGSATLSEVFTDSNGEAFARFIAGDRSGDGNVTAIVGTSEPVSVTITINAALDSLDLTPNPRSIDRVDDPGDSVTLQAILLDSLGNPVQRTPVRFSSDFGVLSANSINSDSDGIAEVTLTVTASDVVTVPENGTFQVRAVATSEGVTAEDIELIRVNGAP